VLLQTKTELVDDCTHATEVNCILTNEKYVHGLVWLSPIN
jgi:hypothetical protein